MRSPAFCDRLLGRPSSEESPLPYILTFEKDPAEDDDVAKERWVAENVMRHAGDHPAEADRRAELKLVWSWWPVPSHSEQVYLALLRRQRVGEQRGVKGHCVLGRAVLGEHHAGAERGRCSTS
jgi:hypothetical protein